MARARVRDAAGERTTCLRVGREEFVMLRQFVSDAKAALYATADAIGTGVCTVWSIHAVHRITRAQEVSIFNVYISHAWLTCAHGRCRG